jgi:hypothetical protein
VDADGHGDILSIVPDPEWDAMKITNRQKKIGRDGDISLLKDRIRI